ncbi:MULTISPECIES: hypothetical protein [unclassified Microbulbifer]|uniref:hypothetical protein n=1 Tax=unclassified Microbulbifer TaxID=2619833 RepID=UPI0027E5622D|nr:MULTISPECIES: hypothetical protein [unclassified Microbulbifer]
MKIYEKADIDRAFESVMRLIDKGADLQSLRTFGGSLSITVASRLAQLKSGSAKSRNRELEIAKLEEVVSCLNFKLNSSDFAAIAHDVSEAYKIYAMQ